MLLGGVLLVVGALLTFGSRIPWLGRLPGDIRIEGDKGGFYFPLATCLVVSVVLSGLLALIRKFFG